MSTKPLSKTGELIKVGDFVRYWREERNLYRSCVVKKVTQSHRKGEWLIWGFWEDIEIPPESFLTHIRSHNLEHVEELLDKEYEELLV